MGVLNVTPDSFSDGGRYLDADRAVEHALAMEAAGADVIDVGGESSRPVGAVEIPLEVELARVTPVLARLGKRLRVPISIDTRRAEVARVALESGAAIINDITALEHDPEMAPLAARTRCAVVLMHMRGGPANHIEFARYRDVVREVVEYLAARARFAADAGVARSRIIVDPGLPEYVPRWEEAGLRVAARGPRNEMRAFDLSSKRFFLATLFQPQLSSTGEQPHPLVLGYLRACAEFRATRKAAMARSV